MPSHSIKTDVLVVGGGNAGLCAAIEAAKTGARVILAEAAPRHSRGGNSRHTRNFRAMHDQPVETLKDRYSSEEYWQDILGVTQGNTNEVLTKQMINATPELLEFYLSHGVRFQEALSGTLSLSRTNAFFLGGGCAALNALYLAAERTGVVADTGEIDDHGEPGQLQTAVLQLQQRLAEFEFTLLKVGLADLLSEFCRIKHVRFSLPRALIR